ncbi:hypothetical protein [Pseudoxanthomonas sp. Root630]|uniref:hypothetical protein n=1 Tax=Pseudoxanthomonas sp. Root630 TaxID=1736574 RepID=UPI0007036C93|nr:hypothetical protein [Pseudoxanthomonas sp. Root630]KRA46306.1 hypothetical protein ASD72_03575 [Pseudoxanthomonas sp. Root630]
MDGFLDYLQRFGTDLIGRAEGPMTFRFFLQPTMAFLAALHDGIKDAKLGRSPYLVRMATSSRAERLQSFREGVTAVTRVLLLGVGMDVIYQFKVFGGFRYPLETFVIAVLLAFVPYLLLRGPVARVARWWRARHSRKGAA